MKKIEQPNNECEPGAPPQPAYAELLAEEANELQERATPIEEAAHPPPPTDAPQPPAQLQQQVQPAKEDEA
jgi:hypothetical protein